jgi:outer membrane protein assembly factor BamB
MKALLLRRRPQLHCRICAVLLGTFPPAWLAHTQPLWPQFRGPTGQGIAPSAHPPIEFSKSDALWATEVPPGHSSPCIWGSKIFLTTWAEKKLECRAYDRSSGKLAWAKPVKAETIEKTHAFSNPAAPTAAADAERVIFYFGSYGLLAFKHDGELAWEKQLPAQVSRGKYGSGSSPVLCDDLVILALDSDDGASRLLAFKRRTGEQAWEAPRPLFSAGWSTPVVWPGNGKSEIVVLGSRKLVAYDPAEGKELWSVAGFPMETVPSAAFDNDHLFACSAGMGGRSNPQFEAAAAWIDVLRYDSNKDGKIQFSEVPENYRLLQRPELPEGHPGRLFPAPLRPMLERMDKDKDGAVSHEEWTEALGAFEKMDVPVLMALRRSAEERDLGTNRVSWKTSRGIPETPSPLCYQGRLFLVRDGGLVQCLEAATGAVLYHERLGVPGGYSASPVAADNRVYLASQSGTISVIDARPNTLKVLARNALGEKITATPALVEDKIYVRTEKHLFAFGGR